ncbi:MAG TPA: CHAT domain-containing protein [Streptosporangiaceae bacterium]|nr:CHAT domain-containing protein [Streptosporangiaceae bacterium]
MADKVLAEMAARLERVRQAGDLSLTLEPGALEAAWKLAAALRPSGRSYLRGSELLGYFYLLRFAAQPAGEGSDDLDSAVEAFTRCFLAGADVPDEAAAVAHLVADAAAPEAVSLLFRAQASTDPDEARAAVELWRRVVSITPPDDRDWAARMSDLGRSLQLRFLRAGDLAALNESVMVGRQALSAAAASEHLALPVCLSNVGGALLLRFQQTDDENDLREAIDVFRRGAEVARRGHRGLSADEQAACLAMCVSNQASALRMRYLATGAAADLEAAIVAARAGIGSTRPGNENLVVYKGNLGLMLYERYERSGQRGDLTSAIAMTREALDDLPPDHPHVAMYSTNLGNALRALFAENGDEATAGKAVDAAFLAVKLTHPDHPDLPLYLANLSTALQARYEAAHVRGDLDQAVEGARMAVEYGGEDRRNAGLIFGSLSTALEVRFRATGDEADLTGAIEAGRRAAGSLPARHPQRGVALANLGHLLLGRYRIGGDQADLEAAVATSREAVSASGPDSAGLAAARGFLSQSLLDRYLKGGRQADLAESIEAGELALAGPVGPRVRPDLELSLGRALRARYEQSGDVADQDAAARLMTSASEGLRSDDQDRVDFLSALGEVIGSKSPHGSGRGSRSELLAVIARCDELIERSGDRSLALAAGIGEAAAALAVLLDEEDGPADLVAWRLVGLMHWYRYQSMAGESSVQPPEFLSAEFDAAIEAFLSCFLSAAQVPPELDADLARRACGPGLLLLEEGAMTGDAGAVDAAARVWRRIVAATPAGEPELAARSSYLGLALMLQFLSTGDREELEASVAAARGAVEHLPAGDENLDSCLAYFARCLRIRYLVGSDPADLEEAVGAARRSVAVAGDSPDRPRWQASLARILLDGYQQSGSEADLRETLGLCDSLSTSIGPEHPMRAEYLGTFGLARHCAWTRYGRRADLDAAVESLREGSESPGGRSDRTACLGELGGALLARFTATDQRADLDEAVAALRQAIGDLPAGQPDWVAYRYQLGQALHVRFVRFGKVSDLDEAVAAVTEAASAAPERSPNASGYLMMLGTVLRERFDYYGEQADLDGALAAGRRSVALCELGSPGRPVALSNLAVALLRSFERTGLTASLDEALDAAGRALEAMPAGDPNRAVLISSLGIVLQERFEETADLGDLDRVISGARGQVGLLPAGSHGRPVLLGNLSAALYLRYERAGEETDLADAISAGRAALHEPATGLASRPGYLANLAAALQARSDRTGMVADLDEAIQLEREASKDLPEGHPFRAQVHANLAGALVARFERTGHAPDLDEAIVVGRLAIARPAALGHVRRVALQNLSAALLTRYERTGDLAELNEAITLRREQVEFSPEGHADRHVLLAALGSALHTRFWRGADHADLEEALASVRQAIEVTPAGHPALGEHLAELAVELRDQYERSGDAVDLDEAIAAGRSAAAAIPPDHPVQAAVLSALSSAIASRFERTSDLADLAESLELARQALASTPVDHPLLSSRLRRLGDALAAEYKATGSEPARAEALDLLARAAAQTIARPHDRIYAARSAALMLADEDPARAADRLELAVRLLPQVAPRQLLRSDQQHALGRFAFLAGDAAALVLRAGGAGAPARALGLLELGRAVLYNQELDARDDVAGLRQAHPELAGRLLRLRSQLDQPVAPLPAGQAGPDRHLAAAELGAVLEEIRRLDGFGGFLLPPEPGQLTAHADRGPIAVINVSQFGSDAILITENGISQLALYGLAFRELTKAIDAFHRALAVGRDPETTGVQRLAAQETMSSVLEWLWDAVAGPVLGRLGYDQPADATAGRRIWWIPGGLLGMLPLHAAGYHRERAKRTVLDRVVSSYTPTVRALARARERSARVPARRSLIVAMPETPQGAPLPNAEVEAAFLRDRLPEPLLLTSAPGDGPAPVKANVLPALVGSGIVHFACHARSEQADPSASLLVLDDYRTDPLTVASLTGIRLGDVQLAYLSACQTSQSSSVELLDEGIHLTSAFQLIGFPHVIGTLWEIYDHVAAELTERFYEGLQTAPRTFDVSASAVALHLAVVALRDRRPGQPGQWAAFLQAGA